MKWIKRNTTYTSYVSSNGAWVIQRQGRQRNSMWSLKWAKKDGDPYMFMGSYPTLKDAQESATWELTVSKGGGI